MKCGNETEGSAPGSHVALRPLPGPQVLLPLDPVCQRRREGTRSSRDFTGCEQTAPRPTHIPLSRVQSC